MLTSTIRLFHVLIYKQGLTDGSHRDATLARSCACGVCGRRHLRRLLLSASPLAVDKSTCTRVQAFDRADAAASARLVTRLWRTAMERGMSAPAQRLRQCQNGAGQPARASRPLRDGYSPGEATCKAAQACEGWVTRLWLLAGGYPSAASRLYGMRQGASPLFGG